MTPWECDGCGCEYQWYEPNQKYGAKFCDTCIDDPKMVKKAWISSRIPGGWWFALGILFGMMLTKIFLCNHQ